MKRFIIMTAAGLALATPAYADDDGSWSADSCGLFCVTPNIDVSNGAISTEEILNGTIKKEDLATALRDEIEGKADKSYVDQKDAALQGQLDTHETRLDANDAKNGEQDARLDGVEAKNTEQDGRLDGVEAKNDQQDKRLDKQKAVNKKQWKAIGALKDENQDQWAHIGSLETVQAEHGARLDHHDALLSQHAATLGAHAKRLDEHEKGLAIAMSLPDLYLTEKERFSIAGNIGGFGDEMGIGAGVAVRLDRTWSLNGKLGTDMDFEQLGWAVGARAGW